MIILSVFEILVILIILINFLRTFCEFLHFQIILLRTLEQCHDDLGRSLSGHYTLLHYTTPD